MKAKIALNLLFLSIWLGVSGFLITMGVQNGGLSDGQLPYGNLLAVLMWQAIMAPVALGTLWATIHPTSTPWRAED